MAAGVSLAEALKDKSVLGQHDGRKIVRATVVIKKAGDGLSNALGIEPQTFHHGQRVAIALEGVVMPIKYVPIVDKGTDTGLLEVVFEIDTEGITFVDRDLVADALDTMADRIKQARDDADAAAGKLRLGDTPTPDGGTAPAAADVGDLATRRQAKGAKKAAPAEGGE